MALPSLITDAELLALSLATSALNGIDSTTRNLHRQSASDTARSLLAPRYAVAKTVEFVASGEVKGAIAAIATYTLLTHRGINPGAGSDKIVQQRYDAIMAWFEQVRTAKAELSEYALDSGGVLVSGGGPSNWEDWRNGGCQ